MLNAQDNELITRTGPQTPMGQAMRSFWIPAALSSELPTAGGEAQHLELLGDNFVMFRAGDGTVGILDEACTHRGASLTVGRVEKNGVRCLYHGWVFAADGTVVETPNVADPQFKTRFKAQAYPVREAGGMIWVYLGDPAAQPAFPDFAFNTCEENMRMNALAFVGANYVQVIEGLLDSSHLTILHSSTLQQLADENPDSVYAKAVTHMLQDAAPQIESEVTEFGLHYAAIREINGVALTRVASFLSPFWIYNPNGDLCMAMVPVNDHMTALFHVWYDGKNKFGDEPLKTVQKRQTGLEDSTLEAHGMTRATRHGPNRMSRENDWRRDRQAMAKGHFTGLPPITQEDALMTISSGTIRDRSKERLAPADLPIAMFYRVLRESARSVQAGNRPVFWNRSIAHISGKHGGLPPGTDWRTLVPLHRPKSAEQAEPALAK